MGFLSTADPVTSTIANWFLLGVANKQSAQCVAWKVRYNGSAWECQSTYGSDSTRADQSFAFDVGVADTLVITLNFSPGFDQKPAVIVSPSCADANYWPKAHANSSTEIYVKFYDFQTTPWNAQTPVGAADTNMDFNIIIWGEIA